MAEDTAQDAFVTAWMKFDKLNDPQKFSAWVCRIATNYAVSTARHYKGFLSYEAVENYEIEDEYSFSAMLDRTYKYELVQKSVGKLPQKVKAIIYLHYFEGLSIVEIADKMRISQGTVKSQLYEGRNRMRKEICEMDEKWNDTLVEKVMKKV